jgi:ubiquinone/menaquinone biosynthesis C-methylase UbiE
MNQTVAAAYAGKVKYGENTARKYQVVKQGKNQAELRLVERAFQAIPKGTVLDIPCGGGRVSRRLTELGYSMHAADISDAMLTIARENFSNAGMNIPVEKQDVEGLTFSSQAFDSVICFRLFHHFPEPQIRQRAVSELCRVARKCVALSYFSPYSPTSLQRRWRALTHGRKSQKYATPLKEVERYFAAAGFRLVRDFARMRFIHTLHMAVFERIAGEH